MVCLFLFDIFRIFSSLMFNSYTEIVSRCGINLSGLEFGEPLLSKGYSFIEAFRLWGRDHIQMLYRFLI